MSASAKHKTRKRRKLTKKQEDRELIRFLENEQDELPYELRTCSNAGVCANNGFEILSVDSYYVDDTSNSNKLDIPLPAKSIPKPPSKNPKLPLKKLWKVKK